MSRFFLTSLGAFLLSMILVGCGTEQNAVFGAWDFETKMLNDAATGNEIEQDERFIFSSEKITLIKRCTVGSASTELSISAPIIFRGTSEFDVVSGVESEVSMSYDGNTYQCQANISEGARIYIVDETTGSLVIYDRSSNSPGINGTRAEN